MVRRGRGVLERSVVDVLASGAGPMSVAQVQAALTGQPAYTTVMTTLARLAQNGAIVQTRDGRAFTYALPGRPEDVSSALTARRMRRLLADGSDRAGILAHFVDDLDSEEEGLLEAILLRSRRPDRG